jgi:hypothetical protein
MPPPIPPTPVRQTFLDVLARTMDAGWLEGLRADVNSNAVLNALFDIAVRSQEAVNRGCGSVLISEASGGRSGICELTLTRASTVNTVTIPKGYKFRDERGIQYILTMNVPVIVGQAVVVLPLESVRHTELVNTVNDTFESVAVGALPPAFVDPDSPEILDSGFEIVLRPEPFLVFGGTLLYTSSTPTTLGASDYLSAHGQERGQLRQASETEHDFRLRVRNIPDAVSPQAIAQAVNSIGAAVDVYPITTQEPFNDGASVALKDNLYLDYFDTYFGSATVPAAGSPIVDFFDDIFFAPSPLPFGFVVRPRDTVSRREATAYFRLLTPNVLKDPDGLRFFADVSFLDDPVWGYLDVNDHPQVIAALMAIWEEANRKRAAAVQFDVLCPLHRDKVGVGSVVSAVETTVFLMESEPGAAVPLVPGDTSWLLMDAAAGHDAAISGGSPSAGSYHKLMFTFHDATTFTTPAFFGIYTEDLSNRILLAMGFPFTKRIARIEGLVLGDGVETLNLVATVRVLEFIES